MRAFINDEICTLYRVKTSEVCNALFGYQRVDLVDSVVNVADLRNYAGSMPSFAVDFVMNFESPAFSQ